MTVSTPTSGTDLPSAPDADATDAPTTSSRRRPGGLRASLGSRLAASWWRAASFYAALGLVSAAAAIRATGVNGRGWGIPLGYSGDALSGGAQFKNVLETGWYEWNPDLGAPWGQHYHDFPMADNLHLIVARLLGVFTDQWAVAFNVYYILTFPLAAMAAAWFIRLVGGSHWVAFAFGILYGFAPYHFQRAEDHLYLSAYYPVPLAAGLVYMVLSGRPIWGRRGARAWWNPIEWATARTWWTLVVLAIMGTASSYYSVFTLFFFVFAAVGAALIGRTWRAAFASVWAMGGLIVVMLVNMAPDIIYTRSRPPNFVALTRIPSDTEVYALKFAQLVLPVQWSRIPKLYSLRFGYDNDWPIYSEAPQLGMIAAAGFMFLMAVALFGVLRSRGRGVASPFWAAQSRLAFLTLGGFLVGTVGGLSTLFTLLISDNIRAWNRISMFLSLFALAAAALVVDSAGRWAGDRVSARSGARLGARGTRRVTAAAIAIVCVLAVGIGLWDQVRPKQVDVLNTEAAQWHSDAEFVKQIQAVMPADAMIYQMPYMPFPENGPILALQDYQLLRPYLHSTDLRWSYGGIKGRPQADWAAEVSGMPADRMMVAVAAAGFDGIYIDRSGIAPDQRAQLEADIARISGSPAMVSPDQAMVFFPLLNYRQRLEAAYSPQELDQIGSHATAHPVGYWQRDFQPPTADSQGRIVQPSKNLASPTMFVDNPRDEPTALDVSFTLVPSGGPAPVTITWPDGSDEVLNPDPVGTPITRTIQAPPGRSSIVFRTQAQTASPVTLVNWTTEDPVLQTFPVRIG